MSILLTFIFFRITIVSRWHTLHSDLAVCYSWMVSYLHANDPSSSFLPFPLSSTPWWLPRSQAFSRPNEAFHWFIGLRRASMRVRLRTNRPLLVCLDYIMIFAITSTHISLSVFPLYSSFSNYSNYRIARLDWSKQEEQHSVETLPDSVFSNTTGWNWSYSNC